MEKPNAVIDLRSDTVSKPTDAMREAMAKAEVGDDGYRDDPTVHELEALAAERFGKPAAMLVSSGTMGNLVALLTHTGRGGEVLLESSSHILRAEMGSIASVAGLMHSAIPGIQGRMDLDALRDAIRPELTARRLGSALICMENTHNTGGGAVLPIEHMAEVHAIGREHDIPVHIDGARIFNAAVALGRPVSSLAAHCDTVTFCLSKGLSAPFGSVLVGSEAFIERARAFRRMVGGMLRQAGVMAAAGIIGLRDMVDRLAEDHVVAKKIATGLHEIDPRLADPDQVQTNMVMVDVGWTGRPAELWNKDLAEMGLLAGVARTGVIRMVTSRHISGDDADRAIAIWSKVLGEHGPVARAGAAD